MAERESLFPEEEDQGEEHRIFGFIPQKVYGFEIGEVLIYGIEIFLVVYFILAVIGIVPFF